MRITKKMLIPVRKQIEGIELLPDIAYKTKMLVGKRLNVAVDKSLWQEVWNRTYYTYVDSKIILKETLT